MQFLFQRGNYVVLRKNIRVNAFSTTSQSIWTNYPQQQQYRQFHSHTPFYNHHSTLFDQAASHASFARVKECLNNLESLFKTKVAREEVIGVQKLLIECHTKKQVNLEDRRAIFQFANKHNLLTDPILATKCLFTSEKLQSQQDFERWVDTVVTSVTKLVSSGEKLNIVNIIYPVLVFYTKTKQFDRAKYIYHKLKSLSAEFNSFQLQFIITTSLKHEELTFSYEILRDAIQSNIEFSFNDLEHILRAFISVNHLQYAMDVFNEIVNKFEVLDAASYTVLLDQLKKSLRNNAGKQMEHYTMHVLENLYKNSDKVETTSTHLYGSILHVLVEMPKSEQIIDYARFWFDILVKSQLPFDARAFNSYILILLNNEDINGASKVLAAHKKYNISPDTHTLTIFLSFYAEHRQLQKGIELLRQMTKKFNLKVTSKHFTSLLSSCNSKKEVHSVMKLLAEFRVTEDTNVYNSILGYFIDHNEKQEALNVYDHMKTAQATQPDSVTLITMLSGFKDDPDYANSLYRDYLKFKISNPLPLNMYLLAKFSSEFADSMFHTVLDQSNDSSIQSMNATYPDLFQHLIRSEMRRNKDSIRLKQFIQRLQACNISCDIEI
jgi:hypothetical protein